MSSQLELFGNPRINRALNKLTGSRLPERFEKNLPKSDHIRPIRHISPIRPPSATSATSTPFNPEQTYHRLVPGLRDFFEKTHFQKAVVGLSGGIDSTLTFKIAIDALGKDRVTAVIMPELGVTSLENIKHAKGLAEYFGSKMFYQPINPFLLDFRTLPWKSSPLAEMNTKARIRMIILYHFANTHSALVLGTSNKSETLLGYGTKYGDLAADVEVIGELYKTEVYALGHFLNLPDEILKKAPSAELALGQTDAAELGADYATLDKILQWLEADNASSPPVDLDPELSEAVKIRIAKNQHKQIMPPTISLL